MSDTTALSRAKARADRLRAQVSIVTVLAEYGYHVREDGGEHEQQFSCDLHGSGRDTKPSARVYPATNSFHCFGCGRSRDVIQTVREKEGLEFWPAVKKLEQRFRLPPMPWAQDGSPDESAEAPVFSSTAFAQGQETYTETQTRLHTFLLRVTRERELPFATLAGMWEVYDRIQYGVRQEAWTDEIASKAMGSLRGKVLSALELESV